MSDENTAHRLLSLGKEAVGLVRGQVDHLLALDSEDGAERLMGVLAAAAAGVMALKHREATAAALAAIALRAWAPKKEVIDVG